MKPVCSAFNIAYSVQKTHVKAADSIFFSHLDRILHINLRTNSHITSKEHVSPLILPHHRLNKVSGTSTLRRYGRPTGAGGMFPHRVMGGKVKQRCTSEACKWIVSSPFTLQILGKHSIWDQQLWTAAPDLSTVIWISRSIHWKFLFLRRRQMIQPTY